MKRTNAFPVEMICLAVVLVLGAEGARAEGFVDFYIGGAFTPDTSLTVELMGTTSSGGADFDNSFLYGGRVGYWLDSLPWLGFALTAGYYNVKEDADPTEVSILELDVVPVSALLMLRYPLLKSSEFPRGQLYPYLGVGPGAFVTTTKVNLQALGLPEDFKDTNAEVGVDVRAGIKLFHPTQSWSIFTEYRFTHVGSSKFTDHIGGASTTWKMGSLDTQSFVFGVGYHF